ncbi:MAG TPA: hypothetical protein VF301_10870 [Ginsengibacter sp.]
MKYLLIIIIFLGLSCSKDKLCQGCQPQPGIVNAVIRDSGPISGDGCSWLVVINDTLSYHPDVLDTQFQQNELHVKIHYNVTGDVFICGIASMHIPVIHIIDISR